MMRWLDFPVRAPRRVVLAIAAVTLLLAAQIVDLRSGEPRLRIDSSIDRLLPDADSAREYSEWANRKFGLSDPLILALAMDDVYTARGLATVRRVSERLASLPEVEQVQSLATAQNVKSVEDDVRIQPFLDPLPTRPDEVAAVRTDVEANPLYAGTLVSHDGRSTALVLTLRPISDQEFVDRSVDRMIRAAAQSAAGDDARVLLTGPAQIKATTTRLILEGLGVVLPTAFAVMALVGLLAYRSVLGVLVPLTAVGLANVWMLGLLAWAGVALNLVTTIVPPLLLVIGFSYAIHVVSAHYRSATRPPEEIAAAGGSAAWALRHVALPVALTALTTIVGFGALLISPFPAVRDFGWIAVLGVAQVVLISLTFVPAAIALWGGTPAPVQPDPAGAGRADRWLRRLGSFDLRHRHAVLLTGAAVALISALGMTRIQVNTDLVSNFPTDNPIRQDFNAISAQLEGAIPLQIVIESKARQAFLQPSNLKVVEDLDTWLGEQPEVGGVSSVVDYVKVVNRSLHGDDPDALRIPDNPNLVDQILFFASGDELDQLMGSRRQAVAINVRTNVVDSAETARLVKRIQARLAALPDHLEARVIGEPVVLSRAMDDIAASQIKTLSVALVFIFVILAVLFTSLRVGFIALLPNLLPVLFYFGSLGLFGIGLNMTTGLFACIILGVAVDDTIHLFTRFNSEARAQLDEHEGAIRALISVGRPVTITTIGLCLGFLSLAGSDLHNQVEFGVLGAYVLAFAWLADLTLTPALASGMKVVTLWDALSFDLGRRPQDSIDLLRGLSTIQARIAALMLGIVHFDEGARVIQAGDPGDDVYVVIDGELVVSIDTADGPRELARAQRGDVIGEVALYHGKRTANVDAATPVRGLCLTKENLRRLTRRYPRIGSRVSWNLSEILASRVDHLTQLLAAEAPAS